MSNQLLSEIEEFLASRDMGPSYFGRAAVGNTELISRLKEGKRIWPETERKVIEFMAAVRMGVRPVDWRKANRTARSEKRAS